jgi:hypothetical protein
MVHLTKLYIVDQQLAEEEIQVPNNSQKEKS